MFDDLPVAATHQEKYGCGGPTVVCRSTESSSFSSSSSQAIFKNIVGVRVSLSVLS